MKMQHAIWPLPLLYLTGCDILHLLTSHDTPATIAQLHSGERGLDCYTVQDCRNACTANKPGACVRLSEIYAASWTPQHDEREAQKVLQQSCEQGDGLSCVYWYAWAKSEDASPGQVQHRHKKAVAVSEAGCQKGQYTDCVARARIADKPTGDSVSTPPLWAACRVGSLAHCNLFSIIQTFNPNPAINISSEEQDNVTAKAITRSELRCKHGDAHSCLLRWGEDKEQKWANRALSLWKKQCEKFSYGTACLQAGSLLTEQLHREAEGKVYYQKACTMKSVEGCEKIREPDPRFTGLFRVKQWQQDKGCTGKPIMLHDGFAFMNISLLDQNDKKRSARTLNGCATQACTNPELLVLLQEESAKGWQNSQGWSSSFNGECKTYRRTESKAWFVKNVLHYSYKEEQSTACLAASYDIEKTPIPDDQWSCLITEEYVLAPVK